MSKEKTLATLTPHSKNPHRVAASTIEWDLTPLKHEFGTRAAIGTLI
jgi:hypothetical protein